MRALEDYELGERVAERRGSTSYRGMRRATRDAVVIRVVPADSTGDTPLSNRCEREFQVGRSIEHASVVRYLDLRAVPEGTLLIQEDFGGVALEQAIPAHGFEVRLFLDLAIQLSQALGAVHDSGIVHAAVHPESIFVNLQTRTAKLGALGSAFHVHHDCPPDLADADYEVLAYEAPEQTGRIAAVVDYRSDLYSLGATFYRMLSGVAPFRADDVLALTHSQIAGVQQPLEALAPETPPPLARIVDKLLAKRPGARYQSAHGLTADLVRCRAELEQHGRISAFELGARDLPARIEFPRRLYGRDEERGQLLTALEQVRQGASAIVWVKGEAGSGKSTLVHSLARPTVRAGGTFLSGKVEQRGADEPYAGLSAAVDEFVQRLLTEPADVLETFREQLKGALGANLRLLVEALPALEKIAGPRVRRSELRVVSRTGVERRARMQFAVTSFLGFLAERQPPLVLFLDDLQWASATLSQLLLGMFSEAALPHLLFIGGYRIEDAEPEPQAAAPLPQALDAAGVRTETIELGNLSRAHVTELLQDTLHADGAEVEELAQLVWQKSGGNPLATRSFIEELEALGLLRPSPPHGRWAWDLAAIGRLPSSANMLGSLRRKLARLPSATRGALWVAARVGGTLSIPVLAALLETTPEETWHTLLPALSQHLLLAPEAAAAPPSPPREYPALRFAHDRVQQACAELAFSEDARALHGRIGRLLLETLPAGEREQRIFEIVDHFNLDAAPEPDTPERRQLAELNLRAVRRARATAAYAEGLRYSERGLALLPWPEAWTSAHALSFELHMALAECADALGMAPRAREVLALAHQHVTSLHERLTVTRAWIGLEIALSQSDAVLSLARAALLELGLELPATLEAAEASRGPEWARVEARLREHTFEQLVAWPQSESEHHQAVLELLALATPAAYFVNKPLLDWIVLKSLALSLEHGVTSSSSYSFIAYGLHLAARIKDPARAFEYGRVGLRLAERFTSADNGRLHYIFGLFLCHFGEPAERSLEHFRIALVKSLEMGDLFHARLIPVLLPVLRTQLGQNLAKVGQLRDAAPHFGFREGGSFEASRKQVLLQAFVRSLESTVADPTRLELDTFPEEKLFHALSGHRTRLATFLVLKLQLLVIYGKWEESLALVRRWDELIFDEVGAMLFGIAYTFMSALAMAALRREPAYAADAQLAELLDRRRAQLRDWAALCPANFANKHRLLEAELSDGVLAGELYDEAIEGAARAGFTHEVALANERAAAFYERRGRTTHARAYLEEAREAYLRWGATGKARSLSSARYARAPLTKAGRADELDLLSVIKAARAMSSETRLYDLVQQVLQISAQNAGAERALFVFRAEGALRVAARWPEPGAPIDPQVGEPLTADHEASTGILRYVMRTGEPLVLDNAAEEGAFTEDATVQSLTARAILAMPLSSANPEAGVLYLENRLTPRAFVQERLAVLDLLIRQASILIDNARFLERTQRLNAALAAENRERTHAEAELRASERRLAGFLDGLPVGVAILSPNAQLHFLNRAAMQVLGVAPPAHITRLPPLYRPASAEPLPIEMLPSRRALRGEAVWDDTVELQRGEVRVPLTIWASPFRDAQGSIEYAIVAFQDITDAKRAAAERRELEEQVRQAQKLESIGRFAAGVAHDFNNLLVPIQGYTDLATQERDHEGVVESLSHVQEAAQQAAELTRNLLAFARKQVLHVTPLQLNDEVAGVQRLLESAVRENIMFVKELAPELPSVCADRSQLRQVIMNLVVNACDAMPHGGQLSLQTKHVVLPQALPGPKEIPAGDYVVLTVSDTGEGMDAETQARAFEPFYTTKESGKGTGLGLAMVFGIVEQHHGFLRLHSAPQRGTTFDVWLPSISAAPTTKPPEAAPTIRRADHLLLVVEDDDRVRRFIERGLRESGFRMLVARSPSAALELMRNAQRVPNVVITDVVLPEMSGRELFALLRRQYPKLCGLFISGYAGDAAQADEDTAGTRLLAKPFSLNQLLQSLDALLAEPAQRA